MSRFHDTLLATAVCLVFAGCGKSSVREIEFAKGKLVVDGKSAAFPTDIDTLTSLLGPPTRTHEPSRLEIKDSEEFASYIHWWDQSGIKVFRKHDSKNVNEITIHFAANKDDMFPLGKFGGSVTINGNAINSASTPEEIEAAGLKPDETFWYYELNEPPFRYKVVTGQYDDTIDHVSMYLYP